MPLVDTHDRDKLHERLESLLSQDDDVQLDSSMPFYDKNGAPAFEAIGLADVIRDGVLYELAYTQEFSHPHFLTCACYMIAQDVKEGYLWNIHDNRIYEITIPDRQKFMDAVAVAITKGRFEKYYKWRNA